MKKLILRMLREIRCHLGQFISIVLIMAIGSAIFSGMLGAIISINKGIHNYYQDQQLADLWVAVQGITKEQLQTLSEENDFKVEGRYTTNLEALIRGEEVNLRAHSLSSINKVYLKEGIPPQNLNECVIDSKFAKANDLCVGDHIDSVSVIDSLSDVSLGEATTLLITGIGDSPEYAYKVKDSTSATVSQKTFGIIYCSEDTMAQLFTNSNTYLTKATEIRTNLGDGSKAEAALKELDENILSYQDLLVQTEDVTSAISVLENQEYYISAIERDNQASYNMVQGGIDTISTVSYIFPIVFFVVASLILLISMIKMVENQRMQIAVIEAMGINKSKIRFGFMIYAAMASLIGSIPFAFLGNKLISHVIIRMFKNRFAIDTIKAVSSPRMIFSPFILSLILGCLAVMLAVGGVLKLVPAQAMRPKPPRKSKTILIERISLCWNRLSYSTKLILRNIFLNKMRVLISSIGIISSVMLMQTGLSLNESASNLMESKKASIGYDLSVVYNNSINDKNDLSFESDIAAIELTKSLKATLPDLDNISVTVQILQEAGNLVRFFDLKGNELSIIKDSVIIPHMIARDYDIAIGDDVSILIDNKEYELTVTGISTQYTGSVIYLAEQEAKALGIDFSYNTAMLKLSDNTKVGVLQEQLLQEEDVKAVNSKTDITGATADNLALLNVIILIIIMASIIMSVAVIYNITSINLFEREREYATLMVLGYYKNEVGRLLFTENLVIAVLGCIGGLPCGMMLFKMILTSFENSGVNLPKIITVQSILIVCSITLVFAIITNFIMKKKISKIDMIEALKGVE